MGKNENHCKQANNCKNFGSFDNCIRRTTFPLTCSHFVAEETMEKCINKVLLSEIPTAELIAELATRDGVDIDTIKPKWDYLINKTPPEREDDPNDYDYDFECDDDNPGWWRSLCGEGPAKILVVRE